MRRSKTDAGWLGAKSKAHLSGTLEDGLTLGTNGMMGRDMDVWVWVV